MTDLLLLWQFKQTALLYSNTSLFFINLLTPLLIVTLHQPYTSYLFKPQTLVTELLHRPFYTLSLTYHCINPNRSKCLSYSNIDETMCWLKGFQNRQRNTYKVNYKLQFII